MSFVERLKAALNECDTDEERQEAADRICKAVPISELNDVTDLLDRFGVQNINIVCKSDDDIKEVPMARIRQHTPYVAESKAPEAKAPENINSNDQRSQEARNATSTPASQDRLEAAVRKAVDNSATVNEVPDKMRDLFKEAIVESLYVAKPADKVVIPYERVKTNTNVIPILAGVAIGIGAALYFLRD
jgi:hypothetical protein